MPETLLDIPVALIDGAPAKLGDYAGKVMLVVNVASKCGLTPQYEQLQSLYAARAEEGLVVLGFPANDFRGQEPGEDSEIAQFCSTTYGVDFPMFSKITVTGPQKHPLYKALTAAQPTTAGDEAMRAKLAGFGIDTGAPGEVLWNFEKFVVGRNGDVIARLSPDTKPDDPALTSILDAALAAEA